MKFENHYQNNNCQIVLDNGEKYLIYANWIHNQCLDNFKDWRCDAGVTRIKIDHEGQIFSGECHNDNLGNLDTGWELLDEVNAICKRNTCSACTDDLLVKKYAITGTIP